MMERIRTSWELFKRSWAVLKENQRLFLFPVVNFIAVAGIFLFFLASFLMQPTGHSYKEGAHWKSVMNSMFTEESLARYNAARQNADGAIARRQAKDELEFNSRGLQFLAVIYFVSMFTATFLNVAFYSQIMNALAGKPVSVLGGLSFALSRIHAILWWSLFAGAVGYLISTLEQKMGLIGKIVVKIIGLAWSVASVFAIPVIVCREESNPLAVLKDSAATLKKTWGESLAGYVGLSGVATLAVFGSMIPFGAIVVAGALAHSGLTMAFGFMGWFAFIMIFSYVTGVAGNVFQCALYQFAATGQVTGGYTPELMKAAWKTKK